MAGGGLCAAAVCAHIMPCAVQTFQMFTCRELFPDEWFLVADLDVQCYTASHFAWMMGVGLFRLIFYVLAIPLGAFFVLYRQRHHLEEQSVRDKCVLSGCVDPRAWPLSVCWFVVASGTASCMWAFPSDATTGKSSS